MSQELEPMLSDFETALRHLAPTEPRPGAADAAYEAGRRAGQRAARGPLMLHRLATAASLAVAVMAGIVAATTLDRSGGSALPTLPLAGPATDSVKDPAPVPMVAAAPSAATSPLSYLSLRSAVMADGVIDLDRLPAAPTAVGPATWTPPATPAAALRRGAMDL